MEARAWPGSYTDRALDSVAKHSRMPFVWTQTDTKNVFLTSLAPAGVYLAGHAMCSGDARFNRWIDNLRRPTWAPANLKMTCAVGDLVTMAPLGYATYLAYKSGGGIDYNDVKIAMGLYGAHALFYLSKSYCFAKQDLKCMHMSKILLYASAIGCAIAYGRIDKVAGYCWIPNCLWTAFGALLGYYLWDMNSNERIE